MVSRRMIVLAGTLAALVAFGSAPASGSVVRAFSFDDLATTADRIVMGTVASVSPRWSENPRGIETVVEIAVEENLDGAAAPPAIRIVQGGGRIGDVSYIVSGMPRFDEGERVLLFLRAEGPDRDGTPYFTVIGMAQGKLSVVARDGGGIDVVQDIPTGLRLITPDAAGRMAALDRAFPRILDLEIVRTRIRQVRGEVMP